MDKGKKKKGAKESKNKDEGEEKTEATQDVTKEEPKEEDIRTVTITLDYYENIVPLLPTADIQTKIKFSEKTLGETSLIPITDDPNLEINESFQFKLNINSKRETDNLIANPALITVSQFMGTCDPSLYEKLQKCEKATASCKSFDSIVSLYEAFTGDTVDPDVVKVKVAKKKGGKGKKGDKKKDKKGKDKSSKGSKPSSKATLKKQKGKKSQETVKTSSSTDLKSQIYGMCTLDFLPLFNGTANFTETLIISPPDIYRDDRMTTYKIRPKVTITVSIDKEICFPNLMVLNVTIESILNIPSVMKSDMEYKICTMLPMENSPSEPMTFTNPSYKTMPDKNEMKCWPGVKKIGVDTNTTKYKVSDYNIKNTTEMEELESSLEAVGPRLRFNTIKRNLLLKDGVSAMCHQIQKYKKFLVELCMSAKEAPAKEKSKGNVKASELALDEIAGDAKSVGSAKDFKSKVSDIRKKTQTFLHLMSIVDVSSLLYPGVIKTRVACPLRTFCLPEALKEAGASDSYFVPKPPAASSGEKSGEKESPKSEKKSEKSKKKDKSSGSKSTKGSKKGSKKGQDKKGLKDLLPKVPEPPPEPEPSVPVYSENGKQTFIIMEIELSEPITKKREEEDLSNEFEGLLNEKLMGSSKIVLTHHVTKDYYREVLGEITKDIYDKYKNYVIMREMSNVAEKDFIKYLEGIGAYQTYLTSLKEAIALLTSTKFRIDENDRKSSVSYQNFIGEIYVYLVSEMNDTINRLICSGLEPVIPKTRPTEKLYLYAKEAACLGKRELAERYFLERICYDDSQSPNSWFDYAIFNLEIKQFDKAYECVLEALSKKRNHRYSLLLLGTMLATKGQRDEAETCFLNVLVKEPRWIEGWVTLYLFYKKIEKFEGMDMAMEMVKKYFDDERGGTDYFTDTEDLLWSSTICPKTMFFRTAMLLLKMRLYDWVEMALAPEVQQHFGLTHYLLSAVCMYQELYEQALEHIQHTKAYCGPNYAVSSLSGHCHFALNRHAEALEDYYHAIDYIDRPNDIHMVYINCAQLLDNAGDHQEARKLILLGCKYCPTHYIWFRAGQLYLQENDLLSAEECFSEANFKDNRCSECWGYLTIINLKLNRVNEAELCYSQAIKNNLDDEMHEQIKTEFKKISSEENNLVNEMQENFGDF